MSGPHEADLRKAVAPMEVWSAIFAKTAWSQNAENLTAVADILSQAAPEIRDGFGATSSTGPAAQTAFVAASTRATTNAELMNKAAESLTEPIMAMNRANMADDHLRNNPLGPAPTPPAYTGMDDPNEIKKQMIYHNQVTAHEQAAAQRETQSQVALADLDKAFAGALPVMQEIHGEPDDGGTGGGGGGGNGGGGNSNNPTGPGAPSNPNNNSTFNNNNNTGIVQIKNPPVQPPPTTVTPPVINPTHPTTVHPVVQPPTEVSPPVIGTPQGPGTSTPVVSHPTVNGTVPSGGSSGTSGTAAAGVLGAGALGALGARGGGGGALGATGATRGGLSSSGTRAIGSTARASQGSVLGRGTGTGGSGAGTGRGSAAGAGRSGAAGTSRSATGRGAAGRAGGAGAGGRGTAGGRGAGKSTVGKGVAGKGGAGTGAGKGAAGRTGPAGKGAGRGGVGAGAGRGGKDKKDQRQSDVFESEQDWVEDEGIAPGVLD